MNTIPLTRNRVHLVKNQNKEGLQMSNPEFEIAPSTTVHNLLNTCPELEEQLISLAPPFFNLVSWGVASVVPFGILSTTISICCFLQKESMSHKDSGAHGSSDSTAPSINFPPGLPSFSHLLFTHRAHVLIILAIPG